jgi:hypothetical protein
VGISGNASKFFDGPGWMAFSILFYGWTAASSGTQPWLRVVAALLLVVWLMLLANHLLRHVRGRASSDTPDESSS